ncbi:hypothetical protein FXO38_16164 [Capsicum annuum]|nr:hypothetical protein FXO38_16164 [Capsicum annuum]
MKNLQLVASAKGKKLTIAISEEKRKKVVKRDPLAKSKARSDTSLAPHSKRRKTDDKRKESVTGHEKIKAHTSIKEVNELPSGTSNSNVDQAPHEPFLMDFDKQTPLAEQTPPTVESMCASTRKINVSRGTNHEKVLLKVDLNEIESLVKTYVVIDIDSSHRDVEKNKKDGNDLRTSNEQPNDISEKNDDENAGSTGDHKLDEKSSTESFLKLNFDDSAIPRETIEVQNIQEESETEVKNIAFQQSIDNTIAKISSPVSAIKSDELLQKENVLDLILPTDNIEVRNEPIEISSNAFQELMDNIMVGMSTPVVAMALNSDDLSEKVNLPDPFLQTDNVKVSNDPQIQITHEESTNEISTDAFQKSMYNIIAEIFTSVVAMKMKSVSPKEINDSECHIHDSRFPSVLPETDIDVIFYYLENKSKQQKDQEYRYTTVNCLFKTYINAIYKRYFEDAANDSLSTQDDYKRSCLVASNEESLINIIKGFNVPVVLPWHMIDDVYVHWISKKYSKNYMVESRKAYTNKMSQGFGALNLNSFDVECVEDIVQQLSESLDCRVFVAAYDEFLSDQMQIPSSNVDVKYLRKRYATLLRNYGVKKAKNIYTSDHDDPPRPRSFYVPLTDEYNIVTTE